MSYSFWHLQPWRPGALAPPALPSHATAVSQCVNKNLLQNPLGGRCLLSRWPQMLEKTSFCFA